MLNLKYIYSFLQVLAIRVAHVMLYGCLLIVNALNLLKTGSESFLQKCFLQQSHIVL